MKKQGAKRGEAVQIVEEQAAKAAAFDAKYPRCPPVLRDFIVSHDVDMEAAAKAANTKIEWLRHLADGSRKFGPRTINRIQAAIDGNPLPPKIMGPKTTSGAPSGSNAPTVAIIIMREAEFETYYDIGLNLHGAWLWKRKAGSHWIGVLKLARRKMVGYVSMVQSMGGETFTMDDAVDPAAALAAAVSS